MEVTITARHCSVPDSVREHTSRLFRRLERYDARAISAVVNFAADHGTKNVEARLALPGGPPILAHADGPTFRGALERAIDRLEYQLKRRRQRRRRLRAGAARITLSTGEPSTL
jgi:ribosomal subunit interface protein